MLGAANFKIVNWAIRQNKDVKGISIENEETKLLQYADDTTAVLSDMDSAKTLFELLDVFKDVSGLKINCTKTEGMWIGASKENKTKPFGIKWPTEPIKALGLYFTYDLKLLKEKNFIERLDSIKKTDQHLVFKRSFNLWYSDNNKILSNSKICLCMLTSAYTQRDGETIESIAFQILVERNR